jgi:ribosomal-protein-alanine N-acetyltransferase
MNELRPINLETQRLKLEPMSLKFCTDKYLKWLNDIEIYKFLETGGNYTIESLSSYIVNITENPVLFWAIIEKQSGEHIGNIKIDPINLRNSIGEYGILMGDKEFWGCGYAMEASQVVISYCFNNLRLRKISLGVVKDNIAAVKLYEKLGFEIEGVYRMHGFYSGKFCDALRMSLFNLEDELVKNYFNLSEK